MIECLFYIMVRNSSKESGYIVNVDFFKTNPYDFAFVRGRFTSKRKNKIAEKIIRQRDTLHDLVLDLTRVSDADSSCSAAILSIFKNVKNSERELYICGAKNKVVEYFRFSNIENFAKSYDNLLDFIRDKKVYEL